MLRKRKKKSFEFASNFTRNKRSYLQSIIPKNKIKLKDVSTLKKPLNRERGKGTPITTLITRKMPEISERVRLAACVEYLEQPKAKEKSIWSEKVVIVIQKRNAGQLLARERRQSRA